MKAPRKKLYVACDELGNQTLFVGLPKRSVRKACHIHPHLTDEEVGIWIESQDWSNIPLPRHAYLEYLTWEDRPVEVQVILK